MTVGFVVSVWFLVLPVTILVLTQDDIIEINLPNAGSKTGRQRIPHYKNVLNLEGRKYIKFAVKTKEAFLLFSEKHINSINNTDHEFVEVNLGADVNMISRIGVGSTVDTAPKVSTPNILNKNVFKYIWISWSGGKIKVGWGFEVGKDKFMQKDYPSIIEINYLSLFNGWGSSGQWKIFAGIYCFVNKSCHPQCFIVLSTDQALECL